MENVFVLSGQPQELDAILESLQRSIRASLARAHRGLGFFDTPRDWSAAAQTYAGNQMNGFPTGSPRWSYQS